MKDAAYLRLLSREFPNRQSAITEIINLSAILELPKGTEYFFSDIHGKTRPLFICSAPPPVSSAPRSGSCLPSP